MLQTLDIAIYPWSPKLTSDLAQIHSCTSISPNSPPLTKLQCENARSQWELFLQQLKKFFLFACFPAQECWWLRGGGWTSTPEGGGDVTWPLLAPAPGAIGLCQILRKDIAVWVFGWSFGYLTLPCSVGRGPAWSTSKATQSRLSPRSSSQGRTGRNIFLFLGEALVAVLNWRPKGNPTLLGRDRPSFAKQPGRKSLDRWRANIWEFYFFFPSDIDSGRKTHKKWVTNVRDVNDAKTSYHVVVDRADHDDDQELPQRTLPLTKEGEERMKPEWTVEPKVSVEQVVLIEDTQ